MSLGLAVLVSTLTISLVLLYHWGHLSVAKCLIVVGIAVSGLLLVAGGVIGYRYYESRPIIQVEYDGISLGMTMDEVVYVKSIPDAVKITPPNDGKTHFTPDIKIGDIEGGKRFTDYLRWTYGTMTAEGFSKSFLLVDFDSDKKVSTIRCVSGCNILKITNDMSEESVVDRLGNPERESIWTGTKTLDYPRLNLSISLREKKVSYIEVKSFGLPSN